MILEAAKVAFENATKALETPKESDNIIELQRLGFTINESLSIII